PRPAGTPRSAGLATEGTDETGSGREVLALPFRPLSSDPAAVGGTRTATKGGEGLLGAGLRRLENPARRPGGVGEVHRVAAATLKDRTRPPRRPGSPSHDAGQPLLRQDPLGVCPECRILDECHAQLGSDHLESRNPRWNYGEIHFSF